MHARRLASFQRWRPPVLHHAAMSHTSAAAATFKNPSSCCMFTYLVPKYPVGTRAYYVPRYLLGRYSLLMLSARARAPCSSRCPAPCSLLPLPYPRSKKSTAESRLLLVTAAPCARCGPSCPSQPQFAKCFLPAGLVTESTDSWTHNVVRSGYFARPGAAGTGGGGRLGLGLGPE